MVQTELLVLELLPPSGCHVDICEHAIVSLVYCLSHPSKACAAVGIDSLLIAVRRLVELGFEKMVNAIDIKEAAAQGLYQRPLTTAVIEKHLADLGIEPEFGTHSRIRGLSGALRPLHCSRLQRLSCSTIGEKWHR